MTPGSQARGDQHATARELIGRRLDEPLEAEPAARLEAHLRACPLCRTIAQAYEDDRRRLRALPSPPPPRDLWARTSVALDQAVASHGRRPVVGALGALTGLLVALAVIGRQVVPNAAPVESSPPSAPFAIPPQSLAFLASAGGELTLFSTQVNEVCPPPLLECPEANALTQPVLRLAGGLQPSALAVGADGQLLITGRDSHGYAVFGIVHLPPQLAEPTPAATSAAPTPTPRATPSSRVARTRQPGRSTGSATLTPIPAATPGRPAGGSPGVRPSESLPIAAASPPGGPISPQPSAAPTGTPAPTAVQPILSDVIETGAAAAWSPDGSVLAFSAMPADGSHGPDIYVWRPGDPTARALTKDHRSSFASWVGGRILVSRFAVLSADRMPTALLRGDVTPNMGTTVRVETLLLDPTSGKSRAVAALDGAWLPSVDPSGRFVAYWQGRLATAGATVVPVDGSLFIAAWPPMDPFEPTGGRGPAATPTGGVTSSQAPNATASAVPGSAPAILPLDGTGARVADWQIRWASDGSAYGLWLPGLAGSDVGSLTVVATPTGQGFGSTLLEPTPARRGAFALGLDRVAWVAPIGTTDGELRVAAWGPHGHGGLRVRQLDSSEGVPAF